MALFGKSSGNKTLYSKQKYQIRGEKSIQEPLYVPMMANAYYLAWDPRQSQTFNYALQNNARQLIPNKAQNGFVQEAIFNPGFIYDNAYERNDIITLIFNINDGIEYDVGRPVNLKLLVFVDAADYINLDIKEFVERVDADIKNKCKTLRTAQIITQYPVIWNPNRSTNDAWCDVIAQFGPSIIPQTIPYDKAIKTKDGRPVIGSVLTNPTLKDLKTSKPTTPTQSNSPALGKK